MKIMTGNDLKSGAVPGGRQGLVPVADAVEVADAAPLIAEEEAARRVNGAYGRGRGTPAGIRPAHIKERIRALGPTVRLDLSLDPTATPDRVL
jgi:hypothetical protein